MATSQEVMNHLNSFKSAISDAMTTVDDYKNHGTQYTTANQTSERAKITTINSALLHASNCSICTTWDGS